MSLKSTATEGYPAIVGCPKCGEKLTLQCRISGTGTDKFSTAKAQARAREDLIKQRKKASEDVNQKMLYTKWLPNGKCPKCGAKFPWDVRLKLIVNAVLILAGLFYISQVVKLKTDASYYYIVAALVLLIYGICTLTTQIFEMYCRSQIEKSICTTFKYPHIIIKDDKNAAIQELEKVLTGQVKPSTEKKKIIPYGALIILAAFLCLIPIYSGANLQKRFANLDYTVAAPGVGEKCIVLSVDGEYTEKYLDKSRVAKTADEAGYVYVITRHKEQVGVYMYGSASFSANRINYEIEKYDRHTGEMIASTVLHGSMPPQKTSAGHTEGDPPRPFEITQAIKDM